MAIKGRPPHPGGGLRKIRQLLGPSLSIYTLHDLAERVGMSISTLSVAERGGHASTRVLAKIAEVYGIDMATVLAEHEAAKERPKGGRGDRRGKSTPRRHRPRIRS